MSLKGETFKKLSEHLAATAGGFMKKTFEQVVSNGQLGRAIVRVIGKPTFRLARDAAGRKGGWFPCL